MNLNKKISTSLKALNLTLWIGDLESAKAEVEGLQSLLSKAENDNMFIFYNSKYLSLILAQLENGEEKETYAGIKKQIDKFKAT